MVIVASRQWRVTDGGIKWQFVASMSLISEHVVDLVLFIYFFFGCNKKYITIIILLVY